MMILVMMCMIMGFLMSPVKTSIMVTLMSIVLSLCVYSKTSFLFPPSIIVISFSSGMMVAFCYCAMMTKYESKTVMKKSIMITSMALLLSTFTESETLSFSKTKNISSSLNSPFLIIGMVFIILSMVAINKSIMKPNKPLMESY